MNEIENNSYYINVDCSESEEMCHIDAVAYGWLLLIKAIEHQLDIKQDGIIYSQEDGGILTKFDGGGDRQSIKKIYIKLLHTPTDSDEIQFIYDKHYATLTFYAANNGYIELLRIFRSFMEHKGEFPTDVILMPEDWGGRWLSTHLVPVKSHEISICLVKLIRWR